MKRFEEEKRRLVELSRQAAEADGLAWQLVTEETERDQQSAFLWQASEYEADAVLQFKDAEHLGAEVEQLQVAVESILTVSAVKRSEAEAQNILVQAQAAVTDASERLSIAQDEARFAQTILASKKELHRTEAQFPPPGVGSFFGKRIRREWQSRLRELALAVDSAAEKLALAEIESGKANRIFESKKLDIDRVQNVLSESASKLENAKNKARSPLAQIKGMLPEGCVGYPEDWENDGGHGLIGHIQSELDTRRTRLDSARRLRDQTILRRKNEEAKLEKAEQRVVKIKDKLHAIPASIRSLGAKYSQICSSIDEAELQRSSPWLEESDGLRRSRIELFLAAIDLHRAFLLAAWRPMKTNLGLIMDVLKGTAPAETEKYLGDIWTSLFLVVPVVSTTFASCGRLFNGLGAESLGWLLVDEAGQATPQAAVGALWRSQRAVIIGDPRQVEPVVTVPRKALIMIGERFQIPSGYMPGDVSAQRLADLANPIGSYLSEGRLDEMDSSAQTDERDKGLWVGCPLRVHRRCDNPMFSVANKIAYNDLMVWGREKNENFDTFLGDSAWIHVAGQAVDGHYVQAEGIALKRLMGLYRRLHPQHKVFAISPFRTVADNIERLVKSHPETFEEDWADENIGTIHTFQGKEADVVFLVLGGNSASPGAFVWASEKPNILNVAITRAKERIYVIGNRDNWKDYQFFSDLADELRVISMDNIQIFEEGRAAVGRL